MRLRWRYILFVVLLALATAVLPAIASSETSPTVNAVTTGSGGLYGPSYGWSPSQTAILAGGVVTFSATSTPGVPHGVVWTSSAKPTCQGVPIESEAEGWTGTCTFAQAGTYTFRCFVHPEMTGSITVGENATTTITTTPTAPPTTAPPPTSTQPAGPPLTGSPSLRSSQHGLSVRGSLDVSPEGSGGRLEVDLLASSSALGTAKSSRQVRVGQFLHGSLATGTVSFAVKLDAKARAALKRHKRLALTVKITLTPPQGKATTLIRAVVEHG